MAAASPPAALRSAASYLEDAKRQLRSRIEPGTLFVVGNEAGDLDTVVSAVAMAYGLTHTEGGTALGRPGASAPPVAVPFCPFARNDFRLRGDARRLFREAGFSFDSAGAPEAMVFSDELDWASIAVAGARLAITDHNRASEELVKRFGGRIDLIVDHHADYGLHTDAQRILDDGVGSACTLVAEWLLSKGVQVPPDLGTLLLGTILVDTRNFKPEEKRFNARDERIFPQLHQHAPAPLLEASSGKIPEAMASWFRQLWDARFDVSGLRVQDLLRLDYKEVVAGKLRIGFGSIFLTLDEVVATAGGPAELLAELQTFASPRGLDLLFAMAKTGGDPTLEGKPKKKGFLALEASASAAGVAGPLLSFLEAAPGSLPEQLRGGTLFVEQDIIASGFGLTRRPDLVPLPALAVAPLVSRKTVLPSIVHFVEARASGASCADGGVEVGAEAAAMS